INCRTPADAFCQMATDSATALDIDGENMVPVRWENWLNLPIREGDFAIHTVRGRIRVPTVVIVSTFAKVPVKRPKFSRSSIWKRDQGRCQYTGRALKPGEGNLDHIVPVSRGGKSSFENVVLASREVNSMKANRTPEEAGLRLLKQPKAPAAVPVTVLIENTHGVREWEHFLRR
ncbi:MAG: HNH endonuclease domain-containing protein, partial [Verrucomicrobiae bacterium]|nr:HNH endonuclease domain-containing protein [Verrucomicrobiae bacterium]